MAIEINQISLDRGMRSLLLIVITLQFTASEVEIPTIVNRRLGGDTYLLLNSSELIPPCGNNNLTFLVGDVRCVNNQDLFDECGFAFIPSEGPPNLRIALDLRLAENDEELMTAATVPFNMSEDRTLADGRTLVDARIVVANNTLQVVNGSVCHIASLEVYRGKRLITMIRHNGFSLSDRGTIEIDRNNLSYSTKEFGGELYRMNLSCSGGGLPESGCLFFKVRGQAIVTNAKFESTVEGTLSLHQPETYDTTMVPEATSHGQTIVNNSATDTTLANALSSTSTVHTPITSNLLLYVVLGAAGGILILLLIIPILCGVAYWLATGKSCHSTSTAAQVEIVIDQNPQEGSLLHDCLNSNFDRILVINEPESEYACINEEEQGTLQEQSSFVPVKLNVENQNYEIEDEGVKCQGSTVADIKLLSPAALRRTKSQENNLDVVTIETFKPKLKEERSASWTSPCEASKIATSKSVDLEPSQIYDTVTSVLFAKAREERNLGYNKLSHPGYPTDELLSCNDVPSSSLLYASLNADYESELGSAYDVPRKVALAYSVPDVKKKRKKQESKGQSDEPITNPEEMLTFYDYEGHYDVPKCKYTDETTANNIGSLYDQPRIKFNYGEVPAAIEKTEPYS